MPTLRTVVYIFQIQNWNEIEVYCRCFLHCYWHFTLMVQKSAIITWIDVRAVDSVHADDIYKSSWRTGPIFKPESCLNPIGPLSPSTFLSRYSPINKCPKTPIRKKKKRGERSYFPCNHGWESNICIIHGWTWYKNWETMAGRASLLNFNRLFRKTFNGLKEGIQESWHKTLKRVSWETTLVSVTTLCSAKKAVHSFQPFLNVWVCWPQFGWHVFGGWGLVKWGWSNGGGLIHIYCKYGWSLTRWKNNKHDSAAVSNLRSTHTVHQTHTPGKQMLDDFWLSQSSCDTRAIWPAYFS